MTRDEFLKAIDRLSVYRRGARRAPHKPLLLLLALARLRAGADKLSFADVDHRLRPLLDAYAPPVKGAHEPELPYWYLQNDGLWTVERAGTLPMQKGGFPRLAELRKTQASFSADVLSLLRTDPRAGGDAVRRLLAEHFPESLHDDILDAVGLHLGPGESVDNERARRDPEFRTRVLRAYGHRCALTGFHAQLRGTHLGLEAAHVHWHSDGGPDVVANGLALEATMHKLLDAGAWSLTDDRRVLVSQELTGSDDTTGRLRAMHGRFIGAPLPGFDPVGADYIRWHREPARGGVFREPALPL